MPDVSGVRAIHFRKKQHKSPQIKIEQQIPGIQNTQNPIHEPLKAPPPYEKEKVLSYHSNIIQNIQNPVDEPFQALPPANHFHNKQDLQPEFPQINIEIRISGIHNTQNPLNDPFKTPPPYEKERVASIKQKKRYPQTILEQPISELKAPPPYEKEMVP